jgi:hypothetical protein
MTTIILELPDDIAKQAQGKGLLSSVAMTALLKQVLAQQKPTSLIDVMQTSPHKEIELVNATPEYSPIRDVHL